ncbi:DUF951 domain-containing protein [Atribacter laminatus]|jgi:hypothetical protein|uniref:DUF951 domain-containing protein n=1 Tax=Atribacter laminatus TaxID=2847778 RepID=A0A7T1AJQ0_ATRLM|nr:DUF951 domain-containing protein [Atribacter laminatus]QPM67176.1 hypothetical protein RT761_00368 [Atribacter laminatus]
MGIIKIEVEDILTLKKSHPCGSQQWKVTRIGADIGMKCVKCGHFVMVSRQKLEKAIREINRKGHTLKPIDAIVEIE